MSYNTNPFVGKARRDAVWEVKTKKLSCAEAATKYGVHRTTLWRWIKKAPSHNREYIPTLPSRPKNHPNQMPQETVGRLVELRLQLGRCAPIIHAHLLLEGYKISLPTVSRILKRKGLVRKKRKAKYYTPLPRPVASCPGSLVQMDTIHYVKNKGGRFYLYTLIDTYSRLAYVEYHSKLRQKISYEVIKTAQQKFGFKFNTIQTDNGPEFKDWFLFALKRNHIALRHSRVRKPNDNAHVERFNRTIQEECFESRNPNPRTVKQELNNYLDYYNHNRLHLGLHCQTPTQFVAKVLI